MLLVLMLLSLWKKLIIESPSTKAVFIHPERNAIVWVGVGFVPDF
jgi:hypothetical protein